MLSKIKDLFKSPAKAQEVLERIDQKSKEMRIHKRFPLRFSAQAKVHLEDATTVTARVVNLSYGGLCLSFNEPPDTLLSKIPKKTTLTLEILDVVCTTTVSRAYIAGSVVGLAFKHESTEAMIFIRSIMEFLRAGATMSQIDPKNLKEPYQDPHWICMHGDGPTDLLAKLAKDKSHFNEILLTFRKGETYYDFSYQDSKIATGHSIDKEGVSTRMTRSPEPTKEVVRNALFVMAGIERENIAQPLETVFKAGHAILGI